MHRRTTESARWSRRAHANTTRSRGDNHTRRQAQLATRSQRRRDQRSEQHHRPRRTTLSSSCDVATPNAAAPPPHYPPQLSQHRQPTAKRLAANQRQRQPSHQHTKRDDSEESEQHACLPCMSPGGLRFLASHAPSVSCDGSPLATTPAARRAGETERKLPPPSFRLPDSLLAGP